MELVLNLSWLMIVVTGFALVPKRSGHAWVVLACIAALLFPIISATDDMNAYRTFNEAAAALVESLVLVVAFVTIARLRAAQFTRYAVHVETPSDPRSPPAR